MWPHDGTVRVADVAALADRWQRRWPSARHASPAASLTIANMRHLLLDALWKQLPTATAAQQRERTVLLKSLADTRINKDTMHNISWQPRKPREMHQTVAALLRGDSVALAAGWLGRSWMEPAVRVTLECVHEAAHGAAARWWAA